MNNNEIAGSMNFASPDPVVGCILWRAGYVVWLDVTVRPRSLLLSKEVKEKREHKWLWYSVLN